MTDTAARPKTAASPVESMMDELGGVPGSAEELEFYLNRLVAVVKAHVTQCDEVGVTVVVDERARTAAYTTALTLEIDAVQYAVGDGPCLDAYRNDRENRVDMAGAKERWPLFAARAQDLGMGALMALPLGSNGEVVGALNLYARDPRALDDLDATAVRMAARRCAEAIGAATEIIGARSLAQQMEQAMASRAVIEQAKGVLMGLRGLDESAAFELIRTASQNRNIKVRHLCQRIVSGAHDALEGAGLAPSPD